MGSALVLIVQSFRVEVEWGAMSAELLSGTVSHIRIYPLKSGGALEKSQGGGLTADLPSAILTPGGIQTPEGVRDHEFMLVREEANDQGVHEKITQRDKRNKQDRAQGLSDLARIKPQFIGGNLYFTWDRRDAVEVPLDVNGGTALPVEIWDGVYEAVDQGDMLADWASTHLRLPVRLVKATGGFRRLANQNYMQNNNAILMQDGYPIHWLTEASVGELNEKAQALADQSEGKISHSEIKWESFRPQIVVRDMPSRYEHQILKGVLAGIPFQNAKPCDRCPMPKVDQETGAVNKLDPNTVLATYKSWINVRGERKTIFGENMNPFGTGVIFVGDLITTTELRNPPLIYAPARDRLI